MADSPVAVAGDGGWQARLHLRFERQGDRSVLAQRSHSGPLLVQRPFYPEGPGTCHVYVLHPPGGVVGGDRLQIEVDVGAGAEVLVTTPAAGKFYRSAGAAAEQVHALWVGTGACLEWLPQETIVYSGARASLQTEVYVQNGGRFIGWDVLCLGRPASGEGFAEGWYRGNVDIRRAGRRLLTERARFGGGSEVLGAPWGLAGYPVVATLVAAHGTEVQADALRDAAREAAGRAEGDERFGVTRLEGVLVARYLGHHGEAARRKLARVWQTVREGLLGKSAVVPRIWYT